MWRVALVVVALTATARADDGPPPRWWWFGGNLELDGAAQPGFSSGREGSNSLRADDHTAAVMIDTLYGGLQPTSTTTLFASVEATAGEAFANGRGVGAPIDFLFTRVPNSGASLYLADAYVDQRVPLWAKPADRRLEIRAGKLWAPAYFDGEQSMFAAGALRSDAGWEYPSDDHGFTVGAIVDYTDRHVRVRVGEMLEPHTPRATGYDLDLAHARAEVAEATGFYCIAGLPGSARAGAFIDHGDFGSYGDAVASFEVGEDDFPSVASHRNVGSERVGYLAGVAQQLPAHVAVFAGMAWSDSTTESFGATETDRSARLGARMTGDAWRRPKDEVGAGLAIGGLTELHRVYLAIGGESSLLGDGGLVYGVEQWSEVYYSMQVVRWLRATAHVELIERPGFDTTRGPVAVGLLQLSVF